MTEQDLNKLVEYIPSSRKNLERLMYLNKNANEVRIAVFGKYNHGKSTLLNAIIGKEEFKVADKRETLELKEVKHDGIIWVDTPGLDADVKGEDDNLANEGAFKIADVLLIVHNVTTGELDAKEMQVYRDLMKQDYSNKNKLVLVLTQIDQDEEDQVQIAIAKIRNQISGLEIIAVSASRYINGKEKKKDKLIKLSGMDNLIDHIDKLKKEIPSMRKKEAQRLLNKAKVELDEKIKHEEAEVAKLEYELKQFIDLYEKDKSGLALHAYGIEMLKIHDEFPSGWD